MKMKVLNVAEKNDAAKNIAALLSRGNSRVRQGLSKFNKIYEFDCQVFGVNCKMVMTSVSGHLLNYDFSSDWRNWISCNPIFLFEAPIVTLCTKENEAIKHTLERETKPCSKLIIWTDCDREGENIGFEIVKVCTDINPKLDIFRAKFSEITHASVHRALMTLDKPNENVNNAINVRRELDLRIGAAFTRFQTLHLKSSFPDELGASLVSYGSCQFPTLGFVVDRFKAIADFIPEKFWEIVVQHVKNNNTVEFKWKRDRLFDKLACEVLYDICFEQGIAKVESIESKPKSKWRPRPLDTVELEKLVSRKLNITAKETMKIAENLYTKGFISYPRTETNKFPKEIHLVPLVEAFVEDCSWGDFAKRVLENGPDPFQGNKSDNAHPPIHPTKYTNKLTGNESRIYDFIVRHFLACLSKHAEGLETIVDIDIGGEKFTAKGLKIIAKNYLDIYPFESWNDKEIHDYVEGEEFTPIIEMNEGETTPPPLLTESDLIALMEKHGIGTDATHADHIETIKTRLYVGLSDKYFVPRTLGMGLVEGYDSMGFEMSKPFLRAALEEDLNRICDGTKQGNEVLTVHLEKYKNILQSAQYQVEKLNVAIQKYLNVQSRVSTDTIKNNELEEVKQCSKCGSVMVLKTRTGTEEKYLMCTGFPQCYETIYFPNLVENVSTTTDICPTCKPQTFLLKFKFKKGSTFLPNGYVGCIGGCDVCLDAVLMKHVSTVKKGLESNCQKVFTSNIQHGVGIATSQSGFFSSEEMLESKALDESLHLNCHCGKRAVRLRVKKSGPNCGKQFFTCGSDRDSKHCNFFKWDDNANVDRTSLAVHDSKNSIVDSQFSDNVNNGNSNQYNCFCGILAKRLKVFKEGPNKGRVFFSCSKTMFDENRCSFFKWDDELDANGNGNSRKTMRDQNRINLFKGTKNSSGRQKRRKYFQEK